MKRLWANLALVCGIFFWVSDARPVSNEDIRDAILSVVNMIRATEDKLERHEYRERLLGDQIKKSLVSLERRVRALDQGVMTRLDARVAALESAWIQTEERKELQKTYEAVEDIKKNLPIVVEKVRSDILDEIKNRPEPPPVEDTNKLGDFEKSISDKLTDFGGKIEKLKGEVGSNLKEDIDKIEKQLKNNENTLEKYENKLAEYNNQIDIYPQKPLEEITRALEAQKSSIEKLSEEVKSASEKLNSVPEILTTQTNISHNLNNSDSNLKKLQTELSDNHSDNRKSIKEITEAVFTLTENVATRYDQLKSEIQNLNKLEQVMVQTADGVMDTKRRVEYGVHQILLEVGDLVKAQSKAVNNTMSSIFSRFEVSVLDEETGALANLTTKIGDEIAQVWRQIGAMHQRMSESADTLNELRNQTDVYVNGSLNAMDGVKGTVGKITDRVTDLDSNLNYLLGRLSLITQDFNSIKKGLSQALGEIRSTFREVQDKVPKDNGPGPHQIAPEDDNQSSK